MALDTSVSAKRFARAKQVISGGVNSPVRAFGSVGRDPVFYDHAQGSRVWDVDGNEYVDFICSWGPMILGHGHAAVLDAVRAQLQRGVSYGAPCEAEIKLAEEICRVVPHVEQVRMVSSGTEATMTAIRLADTCGMRRREAYARDTDFTTALSVLCICLAFGITLKNLIKNKKWRKNYDTAST